MYKDAKNYGLRDKANTMIVENYFTKFKYFPDI